VYLSVKRSSCKKSRRLRHRRNPRRRRTTGSLTEEFPHPLSLPRSCDSILSSIDSLLSAQLIRDFLSRRFDNLSLVSCIFPRTAFIIITDTLHSSHILLSFVSTTRISSGTRFLSPLSSRHGWSSAAVHVSEVWQRNQTVSKDCCRRDVLNKYRDGNMTWKNLWVYFRDCSKATGLSRPHRRPEPAPELHVPATASASETASSGQPRPRQGWPARPRRPRRAGRSTAQ
jgi:hypothetical protein